MFDKILIANRGEIACRIIKTARRLGIGTVAVYSEADANALHVELADEAVAIGPAPAAQSYLVFEKVIAAAKYTGAQAIHPGYGFLSENAKFADACFKTGLVFIGPPASAIAAMGSKSESKRLMEAAKVPLVPGYHGADQSDAQLAGAAHDIGFPVLIKASAGGGGKGMRIVREDAELQPAIDGARREAKAAFGNDSLLVEKYLERPRHVEIQVFADSHGNALYLHDRDCSVQRRHQKVIEEAPAPGLSAETRKQMGEAAVAAAKAVGYVGAGTVEFLYQDGQFYFIEMNTRLQVEHPVTEMITGLDLVEWQLRAAAGEALPITQAEVARDGHAIEVRLYAEDPARGFLPATGRIAHLAWPEKRSGVRIDTGVRTGDQISTFYDPMIAKVIAWGSDRTSAARKLRSALQDTELAGPVTNAGFLIDVLGHPAFLKAEIDTGFIDRHRAELLPTEAGPGDEILAIAATAAVLKEGEISKAEALRHGDPFSPWAETSGWRMNGDGGSSVLLRVDDRRRDVYLTFTRGAWLAQVDGGPTLSFDRPRLRENEFIAGGKRCKVVFDQQYVSVLMQGRAHRIEREDVLARAEAATLGHARLTSPMPGTVVRVLAQMGDKVRKGTPLIVVEAMKMEHSIAAPADGTVGEIKFRAGDQVSDGVELMGFEAEP